MDNSFKFIAAFALAYLAESLQNNDLDEKEVLNLQDKLKPIAENVIDFEEGFDSEDTPHAVVDQFIQAYNNLQIAVEEYQALERED